MKPSGRDSRSVQPPPKRCEPKDEKRSKGAQSLKKAWRKLLGLESSEPHFEIVTSESKLSLPPDVKTVESPVESIVDEHMTISTVPLSRPHSAMSSDDDDMSSDGTLVNEERPRIVRVYIFAANLCCADGLNIDHHGRAILKEVRVLEQHMEHCWQCRLSRECIFLFSHIFGVSVEGMQKSAFCLASRHYIPSLSVYNVVASARALCITRNNICTPL